MGTDGGALVLAALALAVAIYAAVVSRRAADAADQSAKAARDSADVALRDEQRHLDAEAANEVRWEAIWEDMDAPSLCHVGTAWAYWVQVSTGPKDSRGHIEPVPERAEVLPGASMRLDLRGFLPDSAWAEVT